MKPLAIISLLAMLLYGCSTPQIIPVTPPISSPITPPFPPLPPMPEETMPGTNELPDLPVVPSTPAKPKTLTITWECLPLPTTENFVTGLEASTDLKNWSKVVVLPYAASNSVSIITGDGMMFFRVFNELK